MKMIVELSTDFGYNHGPDIENLKSFPENGEALSGPRYGTKHLIRTLRSVGIDAYIRDDEINLPDNEVPYYTESRNPDFVIAYRTPGLCVGENVIYYCRDEPHGTFPVEPKNFVFISEHIRSKWGFNPVAYCGPVMYNPMDLDYFTPYNETGEYEKDPNLICASSVINKIKNLEVMCDIVTRVKEKNPQMVFKFFGCLEMWGTNKRHLWDIEGYKRLLQCADHVGWVSHKTLKEELKKCTYFLHTSKSETWGCSVQEAVSSGCIAITSDLPSMGEMIEHDYMFKIDAVDQFVSAIDFLSHPEQLGYRDLLMSEARNKAETMWSYEVMGEKWKNYLKNIQ